MIELDNNYDRYLGFATGCAYAVAQLSGDAPTIRFDIDDGFNEELFGQAIRTLNEDAEILYWRTETVDSVISGITYTELHIATTENETSWMPQDHADEGWKS
jgi:hypothetical protein